jgi:hypothetical protein
MLHAALKSNIWDERPLVRATRKKKEKSNPESSLLITPRFPTRLSLSLSFSLSLAYHLSLLSLSGLRLPWWNTPG